MDKSLQGCKVAILVANGFEEATYVAVQKALQGVCASLTLLSSGQSLVNGWRDGGWSLNFPADAMLSSALAADFDVLVVPGGSRAVVQLQKTEHTKRFVNGFITMMKPMLLVNEALELMTFAGHPLDMDMREAGVTQDKALMTIVGDDAMVAEHLDADFIPFLGACLNVSEAA